jgi:hypothetical protein
MTRSLAAGGQPSLADHGFAPAGMRLAREDQRCKCKLRREVCHERAEQFSIKHHWAVQHVRPWPSGRLEIQSFRFGGRDRPGAGPETLAILRWLAPKSEEGFAHHKRRRGPSQFVTGCVWQRSSISQRSQVRCAEAGIGLSIRHRNCRQLRQAVSSCCRKRRGLHRVWPRSEPRRQKGHGA